ncbi:DUF3800 domain-containing protein [uncultured Adlercreutzia sp.]|uniref:DUF3800 domain-containing protein n=1 Tax=uncultured Adlercreutzia sp. TaxID=875803 RepID=UPI0026F3EDDA|nr:DUF3800 domain-containing protein [uncultured Adlercreutzia sp.]
MGDLSVFIDESGDMDAPSKYYILSLVFHNQQRSIDEYLRPYLASLASRGLRDIPFHMNPLMRGNEEYRGMSLSDRKALFHGFRIFVEHLDFQYASFAYRKSELRNDASVAGRRIKRDLSRFLADRIEAFQAYASVKVYYDNGQSLIANAIHGALEGSLGKRAVVYRDAPAREFRLSQAADFVCGVELAALKYEGKEPSATDRTFFGGSQSFKKNVLKGLRRKRLN